MDSYSILDNSPSQATSVPAPPSFAPAKMEPNSEPKTEPKAETAPLVHQGLRFPGEDGGKSLGEMAQRDLDATLQLLAERAQYITGASGAAIALRDGESMVCCASSGPSAPELGAHLQIDSGLSAESVRTKQILRCDDAENDPRVNRDSCRTFGIASVVVMPLVRGDEVYGVFELLSGRPRAFEERDFVALNRLAEMIQTAVEHAEAAKRAETDLGQPAMTIHVSTATPPPEIVPSPEAHVEIPAKISEQPAPTVATVELAEIAASPSMQEIPELAAAFQEGEPISSIAFGNLRRCETCGFPVSEGRRLCLDCEAATPGAVASVDSTPEFFGELGGSQTSWVRSHAYLIATGLIAAATIALLLWRM